MKKIIKLTESDLTNIVKRVITEQRSEYAMDAQSNAIARASGIRSQEDYNTVNRITKKAMDVTMGNMDKHTAMTLLQIGTAFIPFVGPFISMGIGLADAAIYYNEGDKKTAGLVGVFSVIPGVGGLASKLGLSKWGAKALGELGKKISTGAKLLPNEMAVAKRIAQKKDLILSEINKVKSSFKPKPSFANSANPKGLVTPLMSQLSSGVQNFIKILPNSIKVGPKLSNLFKTNYSNIKSLSSRLSKYKNNGSVELYSRKLSNSLSVSKGNTVNLKELYEDASLLKKELENIKSSIPKPKTGGKEMEIWYNTFYTELGDLGKFTSDLEKLWKSSGSVSQTIGL